MNSSQNPAIKAEAMLISDLFCQGRYTVPWHQRYYDWKSADVEALLQDIDDAISEGRDCYFLGAVILVEAGIGKWEINDGQQRMVTLSLMSAALCRRFAERGKASQRELFALRILFDIKEHSVSTLKDADHYDPRIVLHQDDSVTYRQIIRGNSIGANGALTSASVVIEKFFSSKSLSQLQKYSDFLFGKVEVACLKIPPFVDPNAVYETINCRGKKLDDLDLIRNYLYSCFNASTDSERKSVVHDNLEDFRVMIPHAEKASEYMRCHLQCRFGFLPKESFYRDAREAIRTQKDKGSKRAIARSTYVFKLVEEVTAHQNLALFHLMTTKNPDPEILQDFRKKTRTISSPRNITVYLRELRGYKVAQPLIFAILTLYMQSLNDPAIAKLANRNLRRLAAFVMRTAFVAPKFEPSHFEREFSDYARDIAGTKDMSDKKFVNFMRKCDQSQRGYGVLDDHKFQEYLSEAEMTGSMKVKQFLLGINQELQQDVEILNEHVCTIEHILPQSPQYWNNWVNFGNVDPSEWVNRIGNLTLLARSDNKSKPKFNEDFSQKKAKYEGSSIALTRELRTHLVWGPGDIEARQREMVQSAIKVWEFK